MYNLFTSSGGCGDALIVGAKLDKLHSNNKNFYPTLLHFEKHQIQEKALKEIMDHYISISLVHPNSQVQTINQPYKTAISLASAKEVYPSKDQYNEMGGYISTYCNDNMNPFFYIPTPKKENIKPYMIINCIAGRTNDSTKRIVGAYTIRQVQKIVPNIDIICLSVTNEFPQVPGIFCVQTPTIIDAFAVINECSGFIGQDGVLAYYAMMQKKPTYISFHLKELPDHYVHSAWKDKSIINIGSNITNEIPDNLLNQFKKMLENSI